MSSHGDDICTEAVNGGYDLWRNGKWVAGLRVLDQDEQGFWERNGYHDKDPWLEQRHQGD
jgi:DMSO/TMAO reductase YedYZ molybdopterin-dependent catalytic subunit